VVGVSQSSGRNDKSAGSTPPEADWTDDIVQLTPSVYNLANIKSELLTTRIETLDLNPQFGITVHQDGTNIAISTGTFAASDDDLEFQVHNALTIEQAREVRDALDAAIEAAEEPAETVDAPDAAESLLRRLIR
jgi:hypothetical protein